MYPYRIISRSFRDTLPQRAGLVPWYAPILGFVSNIPTILCVMILLFWCVRRNPDTQNWANYPWACIEEECRESAQSDHFVWFGDSGMGRARIYTFWSTSGRLASGIFQGNWKVVQLAERAHQIVERILFGKHVVLRRSKALPRDVNRAVLQQLRDFSLQLG